MPRLDRRLKSTTAQLEYPGIDSRYVNGPVVEDVKKYLGRKGVYTGIVPLIQYNRYSGTLVLRVINRLIDVRNIDTLMKEYHRINQQKKKDAEAEKSGKTQKKANTFDPFFSK